MRGEAVAGLRFCGHVGLLTLLWLAMAPVGAQLVEDHHVGYYYPPPATVELYEARSGRLANASRASRIRFVTEVNRELARLPYAPTYAMFVKGDDADKMIISALQPGQLSTIYRMRALLATLTARARGTPLFEALQVEDVFNFLDLLQLLGFKQITVTDGDELSHQIRIKVVPDLPPLEAPIPEP